MFRPTGLLRHRSEHWTDQTGARPTELASVACWTVRVHVVSDVHGNAEALGRAGDGADALIVLGDLIDFVDYHDHSRGILGAVFGAERVAHFAKLRRERHHLEASAYIRGLWAQLGAS